MSVQVVERAFRFCLDVSRAEIRTLERHCGAARWAFNFAHAQFLAQHTVFVQRKQSAAEGLSGRGGEGMLSDLTKAQRREVYRQAVAMVGAENRVLCAELKVVDQHRSRVTHKGKAFLEPGDVPAVGASRLELELYARRVELAALQQANPAEYTVAKRGELTRVRPVLLEMKQELAARGAYRPTSFDIQSIWRARRDLPRDAGGSPWWPEVAIGAFICGFDRAARAWQSWMDSAADRRAGARVGLPRYKRKGQCLDSFTLMNPRRAVIHLEDSRHLRLTGIGTLRLHQPARRLRRLLRAGVADLTSVTVNRSGDRWYVNIQTKVHQIIPAKPTARQRAAGLVAVDLGSNPLAVLSAPLDVCGGGTEIAARKPLIVQEKRLAHLQRAFTRTVKGSKRRHKAARRLGRVHAQIARQRSGFLHTVSKQLATRCAHIAIEDLDLMRLTASARGTVQEPGRNVKVTARFNRHLLDAGLAELRRQLAYKTTWYGSSLIVLDRGEATATKCSRCGERNPSSKVGSKRFTCPHCGLDVNRRVNAARSIYKAACQAASASVACGERDTQNALRDERPPRVGDGAGPSSLKRPPSPEATGGRPSSRVDRVTPAE
ncbi:RNA-guided endonuclease InsQ/TnpB family protein [Streptomyces spectabilis]|uniref:Transposase n=1 Tax=Streptomyces spectabilis TaxID=68270 RepID=A0A7W8B3B9_STRST|nr:RNA-guided endonuclease TnpB family protein [Streptomyces spectabilis]MBB5109561.1 transposase [Streptomyces spectabilis]GGV55790.1 hypothetical protein GCM10010245_88520 [Streptomyces spectabilis]